jgi:hypothetical protein
MDTRDRSEDSREQVEPTGFKITTQAGVEVIGKPDGMTLLALAESALQRFKAMKDLEESKLLLTVLQKINLVQQQQERIEATVTLLGKVVGTDCSHSHNTSPADGDEPTDT